MIIKLRTKWRQNRNCPAVYENCNGNRIHTNGFVKINVVYSGKEFRVTSPTYQTLLKLAGGNVRRALMKFVEMNEEMFS